MKNITYNKKSFTLIEILVSIAVFVLVITAATGIFISAFQGKQRVVQLKEIEDNGRYIIDLMSREIRAGFIPDSQSGNNDSSLTIEDNYGTVNSESIIYELDIASKSLIRNGYRITSNRVKVDDITFYVNDFFCSNRQPQITISMTISAANNSAIKMNFQTTVSPRFIDFN